MTTAKKASGDRKSKKRRLSFTGAEELVTYSYSAPPVLFNRNSSSLSEATKERLKILAFQPYKISAKKSIRYNLRKRNKTNQAKAKDKKEETCNVEKLRQQLILQTQADHPNLLHALERRGCRIFTESDLDNVLKNDDVTVNMLQNDPLNLSSQAKPLAQLSLNELYAILKKVYTEESLKEAGPDAWRNLFREARMMEERETRDKIKERINLECQRRGIKLCDDLDMQVSRLRLRLKFEQGSITKENEELERKIHDLKTMSPEEIFNQVEEKRLKVLRADIFMHELEFLPSESSTILARRLQLFDQVNDRVLAALHDGQVCCPELLSDLQLRKELVKLGMADHVKTLRKVPRVELISRLMRTRARKCKKLPFRYTYGVTIRSFSNAQELAFLNNDQIVELSKLFQLKPPKILQLTFYRQDTITALATGIKRAYANMTLKVLSNWLNAIEPEESPSLEENWMSLFKRLEKKLFGSLDR